MTDIIATDAQKQEIESPIVNLFELEYGSNRYYFHEGLSDSLASIQFRDKTAPYTVRTYSAIPIDLSGMEVSADGASNRPELTIANVTSDLKDTLGITLYKQLVGAKLIKRQTLEKYLVGEPQDSGTSNPPIEFNTVSYRIDRVSSETNLFVTFELAALYDLQGIKLPRRLAVGKFCSWVYQGEQINGVGGCTWNVSGFLPYVSEDATVAKNHFIYFDEDDTPLIADTWAASNATTWGSGSSYTQNSYVEYPASSGDYYRAKKVHTSNTINRPNHTTDESSESWLKVRTYATTWQSGTNYSAGDLVRYFSTYPNSSIFFATVFKCVTTHLSTSSTPPAIGTSAYWTKEELCGKKLSSCKCRYQAVLVDPLDGAVGSTGGSVPSSRKDTSKSLPFGGFPGSQRY